ncbi:MAG TPA: dockerin type I repeat-containing protein, partial [Tepidisphaeraceae bacterium]|nr:dockerin type I repeat-containing protein [Tepidisphaeraceae bacterium]
GTFTINNLQGTNPLAGTTLDIGRSTVFLSYSSSDPIAAIQNYLANGYNSGTWNGTPTASTGVIISQAAQGNPNRNTAIGFADFADGQGVNTVPNTIELTYTLYGDANLDRQVNSADLQILLAFLNRSGAWDQGDFNYDGQVNSADLQSLLFTLNTSLGNQTAAATFAGAPAPMQNVLAQNKTVSPIPPNPTPAAAGSALSGPGHALRRIVRHRRR